MRERLRRAQQGSCNVGKLAVQGLTVQCCVRLMPQRAWMCNPPIDRSREAERPLHFRMEQQALLKGLWPPLGPSYCAKVQSAVRQPASTPTPRRRLAPRRLTASCRPHPAPPGRAQGEAAFNGPAKPAGASSQASRSACRCPALHAGQDAWI